MKIQFAAALIALGAAGASVDAIAQTSGRPRATTSASSDAGLPPLIDRELFFGNPEIATGTISPDGKYIAFRKPWNGTMNVWVKGVSQPFAQAKRITADTKRPIQAFFWSRDSKYVLFVQDQGGDENFNVYAVNPADAPEAASQVPKARNLTEAKNVRAAIYDVPRHNPDVMYVGLNDRDAAWHDLYEVKISTGERKLLRKNSDKIAGWVMDRVGTPRLATRTADNGDTQIKTPLLVVQGANDPRVKQAESDQIVVALRDRKFPVEYIVAPDEGHGFARPVNNMAMYAGIEKFLWRHVGTRYQERVPADVSARLKEITVDPVTVTLVKPVDSASVSMPTPSHPLEMAPAAYAMTIALGAQSMKMDTTNTVTESGARSL